MTKRYSAGPPRTFSPENLIHGERYHFTYHSSGDIDEDEGIFLVDALDQRRLWLKFRCVEKRGKKSATYDCWVECKKIITIEEVDE